MCGDVDLIIIPKERFSVFKILKQEFSDLTILSEDGRPRSCYITKDSEGVDVNIDVWIATEQNIGSFMLYCTGPGMFNTIMRRAARSKDLDLRLTGVLDKQGNVLASKTESECFEKLGWQYITPRQRSDWREAVEPYLEEIDRGFSDML